MKYILLIIMSLFLTGCGNDKIYEDKTTNNIKQIATNVEVYTDINANDIIDIINPEVKLEDNYKIDTTKLGTQEIAVTYKIGKKKYVSKYKINVVDTTPPLVFSGTSKTVNINYEGEACNLISYGDNYTGDIKCVIEGKYDFKKEGTYNLVYKLSDSSNNTKTVNVKLTVRKPVTSSGNSTTPSTHDVKEFSDILKDYKDINNEIGIDVSKWQGDIDFEKVKKAGATFVMIRIGVEGSSTRKITIDEYYKENIKKAKAAGLKVGVYLYSIATDKKSALEQANWVIDTLDGANLDLPIVFDWESWSNWNNYKISFYEINDIANTFIDAVQNKGYDGMLYGSKYYLETIWTYKNDYPIWLAHYTKKTNYEGKYLLWQLCNNGHIDGINGDVDVDILYTN